MIIGSGGAQLNAIKIKETIKKEDIINLIAHFLIQYLVIKN